MDFSLNPQTDPQEKKTQQKRKQPTNTLGQTDGEKGTPRIHFWWISRSRFLLGHLEEIWAWMESLRGSFPLGRAGRCSASFQFGFLQIGLEDLAMFQVGRILDIVIFDALLTWSDGWGSSR
ncbi:hypothetical protein JTE90_025635 [Oedothorax gibbosus]|uniref:Uncharacterized protein n=1 Tax=Oedothorax gibbosus TaxID=931172 RepID=A0AAV6VAN3_9ARAC|nr:hypothetical protein JTE90_025635 [Oedothorax gibbosus]